MIYIIENNESMESLKYMEDYGIISKGTWGLNRIN